MRQLVVVMGVSGSGKTTIGRALAARAKWPFLEGDAFHPAANVRKMSSGEPLDDADRVAWLDAIGADVVGRDEACLVLACSALTGFVQARLSRDMGRRVVFFWLDAPRDVILERLRTRQHFMPASLLESQFEALSPPHGAIRFDCQNPVDDLVRQMLEHLQAGL